MAYCLTKPSNDIVYEYFFNNEFCKNYKNNIMLYYFGFLNFVSICEGVESNFADMDIGFARRHNVVQLHSVKDLDKLAIQRPHFPLNLSNCYDSAFD